MTSIDSALAQLRGTLEAAMRSHSPRWDSVYHNGGTVLALAAAGTATVLPESMSTLARISAGIATVIIAAARALDFGGRWRWHIEMRNAYMSLLDRVDALAVLPHADQGPAAVRIYDDLAALRTRENGIPGSSGEPRAS